ncbi:MAG: hypothetical protein L0H53_15035 [Candidatus Nitrosocosmicus sp.]|nr:hypothetical protein [Candidatus Nitrosocosmicus sp.]
MTQNPNIRINIEDEKLVKLKNIVKALYESHSINSDNIEEFLKFTLFIVFDEYERDVVSLKKFYSMNLAKYLADKDSRTPINP